MPTGLPTAPEGADGQFLMDNSYLVAAGLPPRRGNLLQIGSLARHPAIRI